MMESGKRCDGMKWIVKRLPTAEEVAAHETFHPRPDGIRMGRINIDRLDPAFSRYAGKSLHQQVEADDRSYGEWICVHEASRLERYVSVRRLKAVNGEVLCEVGFTGWMPLADFLHSTENSYFPVGINGLPLDYIPETRS